MVEETVRPDLEGFDFVAEVWRHAHAWLSPDCAACETCLIHAAAVGRAFAFSCSVVNGPAAAPLLLILRWYLSPCGTEPLFFRLRQEVLPGQHQEFFQHHQQFLVLLYLEILLEIL